MRNIGPRVRCLRTEKNLTLPALAEAAGLSKGLLSKIENDANSNPSLETLYRIAGALGVAASDLIEDQEGQLRRFVPEEQPDWQKGLVSYLHDQGREPDPSILDAMYLLDRRKEDEGSNLEKWKFLYLSIENSFKE